MGKRPIIFIKQKMRQQYGASMKAYLLDLFFERLACPVCGCEGPGLCMACQNELRFWGDFSLEEWSGHAMYHYQGVAKSLIYGYKQKLSWEAERGLCQIMDTWLRQDASQTILAESWDYIIPVASVREKVKSRGFDPAHRLARRLSDKTNIKLLECIENGGRSEHKAMSFRQRQQTAEESFKIKAGFTEKCQGKRLLIFDDIMTTGTTVQAVGRELTSAGAEKVGFLVIQRASL